jgi:hypothetical protein
MGKQEGLGLSFFREVRAIVEKHEQDKCNDKEE